MKWIARGLLLAGGLMVVAGLLFRRSSERNDAFWKATLNRVDSFERLVSERELSEGRPVALTLDIPTDDNWKRVQKLAKNLRLAILNERDNRPSTGPTPRQPLAPIEVSMTINGSSPVALEVIWSNSSPQRWGLGYRVQLGDRVQVTLTRQRGGDLDGGIVLKADYHIMTQDIPWDNFRIGPIINNCLMWVGIILAAMGGLIFLLIRVTRKREAA